MKAFKFCPKCDFRMIYDSDSSSYKCLYCKHEEHSNPKCPYCRNSESKKITIDSLEVSVCSNCGIIYLSENILKEIS